MYQYPFGLIKSARFALSGIGAKMRRRHATTAADWFRNAYGRALADEIAIPLTEAWSGVPATDLSPAMGNKLGPGIHHSLFLQLASRVTRRAVSNGYSQEMPEMPNVYHVYPDRCRPVTGAARHGTGGFGSGGIAG
jgi:hypothetical protein